MHAAFGGVEGGGGGSGGGFGFGGDIFGGPPLHVQLVQVQPRLICELYAVPLETFVRCVGDGDVACLRLLAEDVGRLRSDVGVFIAPHVTYLLRRIVALVPRLAPWFEEEEEGEQHTLTGAVEAQQQSAGNGDPLAMFAGVAGGGGHGGGRVNSPPPVFDATTTTSGGVAGDGRSRSTSAAPSVSRSRAASYVLDGGPVPPARTTPAATFLAAAVHHSLQTARPASSTEDATEAAEVAAETSAVPVFASSNPSLALSTPSSSGAPSTSVAIKGSERSAATAPPPPATNPSPFSNVSSGTGTSGGGGSGPGSRASPSGATASTADSVVGGDYFDDYSDEVAAGGAAAVAAAAATAADLRAVFDAQRALTQLDIAAAFSAYTRIVDAGSAAGHALDRSFDGDMNGGGGGGGRVGGYNGGGGGNGGGMVLPLPRLPASMGDGLRTLYARGSGDEGALAHAVDSSSGGGDGYGGSGGADDAERTITIGQALDLSVGPRVVERWALELARTAGLGAFTGPGEVGGEQRGGSSGGGGSDYISCCCGCCLLPLRPQLCPVDRHDDDDDD